MKIKLRKIVLLMAVALCFAASAQSCIKDKEEEVEEYVKVGDTVPSFTVSRDAGNVSFSPNDFSGKNSLIVLYWVDCADCKALMPVLDEVWLEVGGKSSYHMLALARGGGANLASPYCYNDADHSAYNKFATRWVPRLYIVGPDSRVKWMHTGYEGVTKEGLLDLLEYE